MGPLSHIQYRRKCNRMNKPVTDHTGQLSSAPGITITLALLLYFPDKYLSGKYYFRPPFNDLVTRFSTVERSVFTV